MKIPYALLITVLFINNALALNSIPQTTNEENEQALVIDHEACSFSGSFSQEKTIIGLDQSLESSGIFFYDCDIGIIWQTISPIKETLVLNKVGKSYIIAEDKIKPMQSAQSKVISQLIMALVSNDNGYLTDQFQISRSPNSIFLLPKNKRLKRAITEIIITNNPSDTFNQNAQLTVTMIDRNDQETRITSHKKTYFDSNSNQIKKIENCNNSNLVY